MFQDCCSWVLLATSAKSTLLGFVCPGMEQVVQCTGARAQVQSVLLLTDGLANEGVRGTEGILAKMRELQDPPVQGDVASKVRGRGKQIISLKCMILVLCTSLSYHQKFDGTVYTFGFGSDHDSNLLEAISRQGGGVYYFIDSTDKVWLVDTMCLAYNNSVGVFMQDLSAYTMAREGIYSVKSTLYNNSRT